MTDLAPFTNRPECIKCGGDRFAWSLRHAGKETSLYDVTAAGEGLPECLRVTCERCGWSFNMLTKDSK